MSHWGRRQLPFIYMGDVRRHWASIHESIARNHCYAVRHVLVNVGDVRHFINSHVIVDISDLRNVHASVSDVHIVHVLATAAIPGNEDFARTQWEPTHANTAPDPNRESCSATANERYKSRGIDRPHDYRARNPAP